MFFGGIRIQRPPEILWTTNSSAVFHHLEASLPARNAAQHGLRCQGKQCSCSRNSGQAASGAVFLTAKRLIKVGDAPRTHRQQPGRRGSDPIVHLVHGVVVAALENATRLADAVKSGGTASGNLKSAFQVGTTLGESTAWAPIASHILLEDSAVPALAQFTAVENDDKGSANSTAIANAPVGARGSIRTMRPSHAILIG